MAIESTFPLWANYLSHPRRLDCRMPTCFHEAGHAFAGWFFKRQVIDAEVKSNAQWVSELATAGACGVPAGVVRYAARSTQELQSEIDDAEQVAMAVTRAQASTATPDDVDRALRIARQFLQAEAAKVDEMLAFLWAGAVAEAFYGRHHRAEIKPDDGPGSDGERAWALARQWDAVAPGQCVALVVLRGKLRAEAMMYDRRAWRAVTTMAHTLHQHGRMTAQEAHNICLDEFGGSAPCPEDGKDAWPSGWRNAPARTPRCAYRPA